VLTPSGQRKLREARATHLSGVRRLFLERLQDGDLARLAEYWEVLVPGSTAPTADSRPGEDCA
jgi:cytochrome c553